MSQRSEKYARALSRQQYEQDKRLEELEICVTDLRRCKLQNDRFEEAVRSVRRQSADEDARQRREAMDRARRAERRAREWQAAAWISLVVFILTAVFILCHGAKAVEMPAAPSPSPVTVQAIPTVDELAEEAPETEPLAAAHVIDDVTVTHYCICEKCCGKAPDHPAYGITASGRRAVPGVSVAVDPAVIPLGSEVLVDYGDGALHSYRADDTGSAVNGSHIDLCVGDHQTALQLGRRTATIYWVE